MYQHFVSEFYLAGFTLSGKRKDFVYVFDKHTKRCFPSRPNNVGGENHYNTCEKLDLPQDELLYEERLAKIETKMGCVLADIIATRSPPATENARKTFAEYLGHLLSYSPYFRYALFEGEEAATDHVFFDNESDFIRFMARAKSLPGIYPATYQQYRRFASKDKFSMKNFALFLAEEESSRLVQLLDSFRWTLYENKDPKLCFITSDLPANMGAALRPDTLEVDKHVSGVTFPIARDLIVAGSLEEPGGTRELEPALIAGLNSIQLRQCRRQFFFSNEKVALLTSDGLRFFHFPSGVVDFEARRDLGI